MSGKVSIETEFGSAWLDSSDHYYISVKVNGKWTSKPLHKAIYEKYVGPVPDGMHIHHKDHNPANNSLDNLECVSSLDHRRIHAGWVNVGGEWVSKPCLTCGEIKPLSDFGRRKLGYGLGFKPVCKSCLTLKMRKYRLEKENAE